MCVATFPMPVCRSIKTDLLITVISVSLCHGNLLLEVNVTVFFISAARSY